MHVHMHDENVTHLEPSSILTGLKPCDNLVMHLSMHDMFVTHRRMHDIFVMPVACMRKCHAYFYVCDSHV